jgi:hypothetical protein
MSRSNRTQISCRTALIVLYAEPGLSHPTFCSHLHRHLSPILMSMIYGTPGRTVCFFCLLETGACYGFRNTVPFVGVLVSGLASLVLWFSLLVLGFGLGLMVVWSGPTPTSFNTLHHFCRLQFHRIKQSVYNMAPTTSNNNINE